MSYVLSCVLKFSRGQDRPLPTKMKGIRGQSGFPSIQIFPCTFGLNKKCGIDKEEFEKYLYSIIPLNQDMDNLPGKCILIKIDSGPGQSNNEMT